MYLLLILQLFVKLIVAENDKLFEIQLGRIAISTKIGDLPEKYQPLNPEDLLAAENMQNIINQLKNQFSTGGPDFPTIDPYKQDRLPPIDVGRGAISYYLRLLTGYFKPRPPSDNCWIVQYRSGGYAVLRAAFCIGQMMFKNMVVTGAKDLTVNNHEFRLKNYRYDFNLSIPWIYCEVDFESQLVVNNLLPILLDGNLRAELKGINLVGAASAKKKIYKNRRVFQLTSLHWEGQVDDPRIYVDYELGNSLGIMDNSIKEVMKKHIADTNVGNIVLKGLNNVLRSYPAEAIIKGLLKSRSR